MPRPGLALALATVVACTTSASGEVVGGGPRPGYDAAAPALLVLPCTEPSYADAPAATWKSLYGELFGCHATSSCAGSGACHGDAGQDGARASNFVCADLASCYASLRHGISPYPTSSVVPLVADSDVANPQNAYLFKVIRRKKSDGSVDLGRNMPLEPRSFVFSSDQIDRMQTWIRDGALEN